VVNLEPGDLVIAWSDGITEPENDYGEEFGEERLFSIVEAHADRPLDVITQAVLSRVREWNSSQEQPDDVSLVLARVQ
jgi:sigma-B regulation protein RsbU (phosphoserine phosphatase)